MSIVVTGVGVASAAGAGFEAFGELLAGAPVAAREVDRGAGHHRPGGARFALCVPPEATAELVERSQARRLSPASRFAVAASRLALRDAGLDEAALAGEGLSVSLGTAFGSTSVSWKILEQCADPGPQAISPFLFTESVASAHAGQVALAFGARGPNTTVSQGEVSAALAVANGAELVRSGRARVVLAGGVDEVSPLLHAILERSGALSRVAPGAGEPCARPFDRRRDGFVVAEGSVVLVLEDEQDARRRGARPRARLAASARACDPSALPGAFGNGAARLAARCARELERQGVGAERLDLVLSGASGSRAGDALEAGVLRRLFPAAPPPLIAPKARCGELAGFNLAAAVHLLAGGALPAPNGFEPDPALGSLRPAGAPPRPRSVLSSWLAAGGPAAWLVWEAPGG